MMRKEMFSHLSVSMSTEGVGGVQAGALYSGQEGQGLGWGMAQGR